MDHNHNKNKAPILSKSCNVNLIRLPFSIVSNHITKRVKRGDAVESVVLDEISNNVVRLTTEGRERKFIYSCSGSAADAITHKLIPRRKKLLTSRASTKICEEKMFSTVINADTSYFEVCATDVSEEVVDLSRDETQVKNVKEDEEASQEIKAAEEDTCTKQEEIVDLTSSVINVNVLHQEISTTNATKNKWNTIDHVNFGLQIEGETSNKENSVINKATVKEDTDGRRTIISRFGRMAGTITHRLMRKKLNTINKTSKKINSGLKVIKGKNSKYDEMSCYINLKRIDVNKETGNKYQPVCGDLFNPTNSMIDVTAIRTRECYVNLGIKNKDVEKMCLTGIQCKVIIKNSKSVQKLINDLIGKVQEADVLNVDECIHSMQDRSIRREKLITCIENNSEMSRQLDEGKYNLRKHKLQNYTENSILKTPEKKNVVEPRAANHVPIYRQINIEEKSAKEVKKRKNDDQYEFNSDSENVKGKRRRKGHVSADTSTGFDRGMKSILRDIEKKFKQQDAKTKRRKPVTKKISAKRNMQIESMTSVPVAGEVVFNGALVNKSLVNVMESIKTKIQNKNMIKSQIKNTVNKNVDAGGITKSIDSQLQNKEIELGIPKYVTTNNSPAERIKNNKEMKYLTNTIFPNTIAGQSWSVHEEIADDDDNYSQTYLTRYEAQNSCDNFFGFESDNTMESSPANHTNRVNIISNLIINQNLSKPTDTSNSLMDLSYEKFKKPNANSTILIRKRPSSPWRPNLGVTRNPHLLQIKETLLPNFNQEMIIDSNVAEKTAINIETPDKLNNTKRSHQTNILDYVSCSNVNNLEVAHDCSLFDAADFSPIKSKSIMPISQAPSSTKLKHTTFSVNKENLPEARSKSVVKIKRNILGTISNNIIPNNVTSTPLKTLPDRNLQLKVAADKDLENYFGFESFSENCEVHKKSGGVMNKQYIKKPVRYDDVITRRVKEKRAVSDPIQEEDVKEVTFDKNDAATEICNEELMVGLFEDLEPVRNNQPTARRYERKKQRRQRQPSMESNVSEDDVERRKHRKKNVQTKQEEEEVERWAAAFNSMCQEVDQYTLEIG